MPPLPHRLHRWDLSPAEAVDLQRELALRVDTASPAGPVETVAGCDVAYDVDSTQVFAAAVVVRLSDQTVVDQAVVAVAAAFPYVPGLLSFREAPAVLAAWEGLRAAPDAVMLDAQGIAHPRRFGLACHVGLWVDRPAVGAAKSRLVGAHAEPGPAAGDFAPLTHDGGVVGAAVRAAAGAKPIYVSPGHRTDVGGAVAVARRCLSGYRHLVPTRLAHLAANAARAGRTA